MRIVRQSGKEACPFEQRQAVYVNGEVDEYGNPLSGRIHRVDEDAHIVWVNTSVRYFPIGWQMASYCLTPMY